MTLRDPVCGMDLAETPEEAEALGAFVVEKRGQKHYLCSVTCKQVFEKLP